MRETNRGAKLRSVHKPDIREIVSVVGSTSKGPIDSIPKLGKESQVDLTLTALVHIANVTSKTVSPPHYQIGLRFLSLLIHIAILISHLSTYVKFGVFPSTFKLTLVGVLSSSGKN